MIDFKFKAKYPGSPRKDENLIRSRAMEKTERKKEEIFKAVSKKFGFIPNLFRTLSISPAVAEVYLRANEAMEGASIPPAEAHAVNLAISAKNGCKYCLAAHTALGRMHGLSSEDMKLIKAGELPSDPALATVVRAVWLIMEKKGWLSEEDLAAFEKDGVDRARTYEIIALLGIKTLANYVNHIAKTKIDKEFTEGA
jgi:AhpD family alkylhydroperoxidase